MYFPKVGFQEGVKSALGIANLYREIVFVQADPLNLSALFRSGHYREVLREDVGLGIDDRKAESLRSPL